jgi:hypothetical protein
MAMVLATAGVALILSGCSTEGSSLGLSELGGSFCSEPRDAPLALGVHLDNSGDRPITVVGIEPVDMTGLSVPEFRIMDAPDGPGTRLGLAEYPPTEELADAWVSSRDAVGAMLSPGSNYDLVVKVEDGGEAGGKLGGVRVTYEESGRERSETALVPLEFAASLNDCS